MRIQHNIPAMSAYRNYTNNTSSLSKNLEKLSSGYKINRAGDDAAGLAISEKMRAQITGLEVAQKNAKDGISLVQTAEGALTEVHSMLNRMYELAEQSANGTYDNDVDRLQLQKEVNQLRSEIDRISEASNFNGIKLLDGSMNAQDVTTVNPAVDRIDVPILQDVAQNAFTEVGDKTVLKKAPTKVAKTSFDIDLQSVKVENAKVGNKITMTIGEGDNAINLSLTITKDASEKAGEIGVADAADTTKIAKAFTTLLNDKTGTNPGGKIAGQDFTIKENGHTITFAQTNDPTKESEVVDAALPVKITYGAGAPGTVTYSATVDNMNGQGGGHFNPTKIEVSNIDETLGKGTAEKKSFTLSLTYGGGKLTGTIQGGPYTSATNIKSGAVDVQDDTNGYLTVVLDNEAQTTFKIYCPTGDSWTENSNQITFDMVSVVDTNPDEGQGANSWNVSTTKNVQGAIDDPGQLASTQITLKDSFATHGGALHIGENTYVFQVGDDPKNKITLGEGEQIVTISDDELAAAHGDVIDAIGMKLSQTGNTAFTLGYNQETKQLSIHETVNQSVYDEPLQSLNSFQKLIGASRHETKTTTTATGKSLTLQIGDTSETFNKLVVDVKACNAASMGIGAIDISTQEGAAAAMTAIKSAINYVSDVRGDLGATQNRLDHTINNLSVMQENIQDAESTIRDVDVAKEMMDYTKNNILVQSAQAMLAQANQLPQGVLQLLQ